MSDPFGTRHAAAPGSPASAEPVHEAYSFACMNCGHGWEQAYDIAHHTDEHGHTSCVYYADSQRVPSPLTQPTCANCGGHLVRIMRSGRVSGARWEHLSYAAPRPPRSARGSRATLSAAGAMMTAGGDLGDDTGAGQAGDPQRRSHWMADLLVFLHLRHSDEADGDGERRRDAA